MKVIYNEHIPYGRLIMGEHTFETNQMTFIITSNYKKYLIIYLFKFRK